MTVDPSARSGQAACYLRAALGGRSSVIAHIAADETGSGANRRALNVSYEAMGDGTLHTSYYQLVTRLQ
jgi:hypothetical protein